MEEDEKENLHPSTPEPRLLKSEPVSDMESDVPGMGTDFEMEKEQLEPPIVSTRTTARNVSVIIFSHRNKTKHEDLFKPLPEDCILPTQWDTRPQLTTCPHCSYTGLTTISCKVSCSSFLCCSTLLLTACLCLTALCCPCCMDIEHKCGKCKAPVGYRSVV